MEYIIFGAGEEAKTAFSMLSDRRVGCFVDNGRAGSEFCGKPVLSRHEMVARYRKGKSIVVIADSRNQFTIEMYLREMEAQRYFVFSAKSCNVYNNTAPAYWIYRKWQRMSWAEVLMRYQVERYQCIAVSGNASVLPYLMSEIAFQCDGWKIDCIVDDEHAGAECMGVPVIEAEKKQDGVDAIVISEDLTKTDVRRKLPKNLGADILDLVDITKFIPAFLHPELKRFKGIHQGKKCFIIGNGPSLRMDDLDKLADNNVICFGVNKIYKAFEKTKWRPTYYCLNDPFMFHIIDPELDKTQFAELFYEDFYHSGQYIRVDGVNYIHLAGNFDDGSNMPKFWPKFSEDITQCVYEGFNSIYNLCFHIAVYMGFKEIYLLGTDCSVPGTMNDENSHFVPDYCTEEEKKHYAFSAPKEHWEVIMRCYDAFAEYARKHDIKVFNATRGGELEVFERVNFDDLFD